MLGCPSTKLELADRTQAVSCGGIAVVQQLVRQVGLAESINRNCRIFKMYMPYTEADHVLNIAFNIFAGGTCLEHLELRRNQWLIVLNDEFAVSADCSSKFSEQTRLACETTKHS